ncbi:hypothetical protein ACSSNL_18600 [Thalassobius sp. S69A]|uniref:hypothetical protein n=1 Tax=unclassified Thalassovita TaxID=2619711 RepID=UPI003C7B5920
MTATDRLISFTLYAALAYLAIGLITGAWAWLFIATVQPGNCPALPGLGRMAVLSAALAGSRDPIGLLDWIDDLVREWGRK